MVPAHPADPDAWRVFCRCGPFATLPAMLLDEVFRQLEPCEYGAGEPLMREGDTGDGLLVLLSGTAHASLRETRDAAIGRFTTGDVVGEMALVTREPRTADVIADTPLRALKLPVAAFDRLAWRYPVLAKVLTDLVAERLGRGTRDGLGGKSIDRYRIERCIGRGGMAVVYHARDQHTGKAVALKMMSHRLVYEAGALARFHQEAELLRSLDHPNIASIERLFPAYNTYFLVMELYDGVDLERLVTSHGPFSERQVRPILGQLASALDYVHQRGLIHRDLKPANVMLTRSGVVKLMDFGVATTVVGFNDETRLAAGFEGTPVFMAPEQLSNVPLDGRADIYALACVAYVLLTGRSLFSGKTLVELVQEKLSFRLPPATEIAGGISEELHSFLTGALNPSRDNRWLSVTSLAEWAAPVDAALLNPA
jgi:eukaryotic-like serine/threonine-protein kinase